MHIFFLYHDSYFCTMKIDVHRILYVAGQNCDVNVAMKIFETFDLLFRVLFYILRWNSNLFGWRHIKRLSYCFIAVVLSLFLCQGVNLNSWSGDTLYCLCSNWCVVISSWLLKVKVHGDCGICGKHAMNYKYDLQCCSRGIISLAWDNNGTERRGLVL